MSNRNEYQIIKNSNKDFGLSIKRGDTSLNFSPEATQQICSDLIKLGGQFISDTSRITVEAFRTQADMYFAELNTYLKEMDNRSEERMKILEIVNQTSQKYFGLINESTNKEKTDALIHAQKELANMYLEKYLKALDKDAEYRKPARVNIFSLLKNLFSKK